MRSIFPETTIVRPAPIFGFEDNLLLKLASVVNLFTANNMQERFWPVHVVDVGEALEKILYDDKTASQTYELYGPKNYSTAEIAELVDLEIFKRRRHINVPKSILKPAAGLLNRLLWWDIMSADQVEREFHDQVIDETAKTFKDLGIEPTDISKWTYHYLVCISRFMFAIMCDVWLTPNRKARVTRRTTTCRPRRRRRCGRRRSTSTCWTTSKRGLVRRAGWLLESVYIPVVTRRYFPDRQAKRSAWAVLGLCWGFMIARHTRFLP